MGQDTIFVCICMYVQTDYYYYRLFVPVAKMGQDTIFVCIVGCATPMYNANESHAY